MGGVLFAKNVENRGCFVKKWTFPKRRVHYVKYQYFFILHFTYLGVRKPPLRPQRTPRCLRACENGAFYDYGYYRTLTENNAESGRVGPYFQQRSLRAKPELAIFRSIPYVAALSSGLTYVAETGGGIGLSLRLVHPCRVRQN